MLRSVSLKIVMGTDLLTTEPEINSICVLGEAIGRFSIQVGVGVQKPVRCEVQGVT